MATTNQSIRQSISLSTNPFASITGGHPDLPTVEGNSSRQNGAQFFRVFSANCTIHVTITHVSTVLSTKQESDMPFKFTLDSTIPILYSHE